MKLTPISLFLAFFSGGAVLYLLLIVRRKGLSLKTALPWLALWTGIGVFSLFPDWLDRIIVYLQMENRVLFVLLVAVFVMLVWIFNLNLQLYQIQHNWQNVVQEKVIFLVGSPRSGTTILENILNCHDKIAELYEPYFLWERFFNVSQDDVWDSRDLTPQAIAQLRKEYAVFAKKSNKHLVLDKLPTHSFNIPIIHRIFPDAHWIHLIRDGRDVTLSIHKEWEKRRAIVEQKNFPALFKTAKAMLDRQPFWRFKLMAVVHELGKTFSLNPYRYLNKSRWQGQVGWGPRFKGWKTFRDNNPTLAFNAMQWLRTVQAVQADWPALPEKNKIEVRYEELLADPDKTVTRIIDFLGYRPQDGFFEKIPELLAGNVNKWENEFSDEQTALIKPILTPLLEKTGYLQSRPW